MYAWSVASADWPFGSPARQLTYGDVAPSVHAHAVSFAASVKPIQQSDAHTRRTHSFSAAERMLARCIPRDTHSPSAAVQLSGVAW